MSEFESLYMLKGFLLGVGVVVLFQLSIVFIFKTAIKGTKLLDDMNSPSEARKDLSK